MFAFASTPSLSPSSFSLLFFLCGVVLVRSDVLVRGVVVCVAEALLCTARMSGLVRLPRMASGEKGTTHSHSQHL